VSDIDAVIFDLGNVLVAVDEGRAADRLAARTGKTRQQINEYAHSTPHAMNLALGKLTRQQFFETVAHDLAFDGTYEEFATIWSEIFTPIEPMIALAQSLKNRVRRLILSNTNAIHMDYIFEQFRFLDDFDALILSHEVGLLKPDAAIYKLALAKHVLTAARTVFIDDLAINVEGARQVGLHAIQFYDAEQAQAELTKLGLSPI
jgi:putative hydrolase of the HAD superfamily